MNGGIGYSNPYAGSRIGSSYRDILTEVGFEDAYTSFLGSSAGRRLQSYTPIMPVIYKDTSGIYVKMAGLY